ncbi:ferredoxin [Streptomyces sp. NPDC048506]|uniref:ferredoxin n=1 Tax=Streptomyces sp. NPDC048506 TaxID=3155028 RepID=UPI003413E441
MKIVIDEEKCVGAGQCVLAAEAVFDQRDADGMVVLLNAAPPHELLAQVEDAAARCPTLAIEVVK